MGSLYKQEFIDLGVISNCKVQLLLLQDMMTGEEEKAVRFEFTYVGSGSSDTKIAILDPDEVDGLIKSIKIIQEKTFPVPPENYAEVTFRSRGGFEAGCFKDKRNKDWAPYLKLERFDGMSYILLKKEEFEELIGSTPGRI